MRGLVILLALMGCKDKTPAQAPKVGSTAPEASRPTTPPKKSPPLDAAKLRQLAQLEIEGWGAGVVLHEDATALEVRYARMGDRDRFAVTVQVSRCFDCLPMEEAKWRAKTDALRGLIAPELRDHKDTTFELGMTELSGVPAAWTYHAGWSDQMQATAYALYFNDGTNMIRVVVEPSGLVPASREQLIAAAPREKLAVMAKQFAEPFVHAW